MIDKIKQTILHPQYLVLFLLHRTARLWSDKLYLKMKYYLLMGKKLDLKNPKTFSEKIQWLKLYDRKPEYTMMVDKYAVKEYVAGIIGNKYVIPTIGVWNQIEDIDWDNLPNQFVLKTTHGGGSCGVVICKDKAKLDRIHSKQKLQDSLDSDIYVRFREWPYKDVPKRIIAEKYMSEMNVLQKDTDLSDYKFYCFNGEPKYCQVIRGRNCKKTIDFYDMQWNHMPFVGLNPIYGNARDFIFNGNTQIDKPKCIKEMIHICRILANGIPFTRIDLYMIEDKVYFGEITFYPASGFGVFTPNDWNYKLGNLLRL